MSSSKYVIIGGGMVAGYAAKEMAGRGLKKGELTIISSDDSLPYERPPLSKSFLAGKDTDDSILINPASWYRDNGIDVKLQTTVHAVDSAKKQLRLASGDTLTFETLLIATGARARTLEISGHDLSGLFYLRSISDSRKLRSRAESAKQVVVLGGGFIGMEVASVLAQKKIQVTMILPEDRVWKRVFTPEMSTFFEDYYAARGAQIVKNANVTQLRGRGGSVSEAVTKDGHTVPCDTVVAGIGAAPVTELFAKSGITVDNGIVVNEFLETNIPGIYAAGDVADYPDTIFGKRRRVEHWDNAVSQGQHWAHAVTGERQPFVHVPYFFSDVFDLSYELWGDSDGATQTVIRGDASASSFSVWWIKDDRLVSAFTMNRPDEERQVAPEWIQAKQLVNAEILGNADKDIRDAVGRSHEKTKG